MTRPGPRSRVASAARGRIASGLLAIAAVGLAAACGDDATGLASEGCGPGPYFTTLPVARPDINLIVVVGGLGAPGHTLPTAHSGFSLARVGAPVVAPGPIQVREVRRVTYVRSPTRQGERDYALFFDVCEDVEGWFGHLTSLAAGIPDNAGGSGCETYSTSDETVEACTLQVRGFPLAAGQPMGTGGLSIERGFMGLDFGLLDRRVDHFYANRSRHPQNTFHAVCPYDYFDPANREVLLALLRDPARPHEIPTGEPRCGTMEVDVAGTAQGVWAERGVSGQVQGDETRFITLANYPYDPQRRLALSLGPAGLGARVAVVPRASGGRFNRAFEQVSDDGLIYCYNSPDPTDFLSFGSSWLLSLSSAGTLRIERRVHGTAPSPCAADPTTWVFGSASVEMVR